LSYTLDDARIAVIGLGYVGLPLAIELGCKFPTVGFDTSQSRITALGGGIDDTREIGAGDFDRAAQLSFTNNVDDIANCNSYIVTVPTPIDDNKQPNCQHLIDASAAVGAFIATGDVVIYESTVYPGATEEICIPVIENVSGLTYNKDFFAGYSPERINPGDKTHRLPDIVKVTSGSTPEIADYVDLLYSSIVTAGTHRASSIQVAEAAKVIENTQRDLNIALINELAMIFDRLDIDTKEVLEAAGSKWNFLPFRPGLVGGHCIGVDPYYLTHKAQAIGYHPEVILAGRRINDQMGEHIAGRIIKLMAQRRISAVGARVLVMGLAFKENCPDIRNTKVVDVIQALRDYHVEVDVYDPWVDPGEALRQYEMSMINEVQEDTYDAIVLAVAHDEFRNMGIEQISRYAHSSRVIFDVKHLFPRERVEGRL